MRLEEALLKTFLVQQTGDLNFCLGRDGQRYKFHKEDGTWKIWKDCPDPPGFIGMADSMARNWRCVEGVRTYDNNSSPP